MKFAILVIGIYLLKCHSENGQKPSCYRDFMNHGKFVYITSLPNLQNDYTVFNDSIQQEFNPNQATVTNKIIWLSCAKYILVKKVETEFWHVGDSLVVEIKQRIGDTLIINTTARGKSFSVRILKVD